MDFLLTLNRTQLERLYRKIAGKILTRGAGGFTFGCDWHTLRITEPGLADALDKVLTAIKIKSVTPIRVVCKNSISCLD